MGEVLDLAGARTRRSGASADREQGTRRPAEFFFDLACPFSYLASETVELCFGGARWQPASSAALHRRVPDAPAAERVRQAAESRAAALRMPLEWPDAFPAETPRAMRAATYAADRGRGAAFALAAGRLAFCGGFDVDDPEILAEAAAAAGVPLDGTLRAAREEGRDRHVDAAARRLLAAGARELPVLRAGRLLVDGEPRIAAAAAAGGLRLAAF